MPLYVSAYDTEAVYPWWESDASGFDYTPNRIREFLAGVRAVADVHLEQDVPATFFLVARMVELAGRELRAILDHSLFDIQCHSFTHPDLMALDDRGDADALRYELADSKKLIEDTFGTPVTGLTAPGGYTRGFAGHPRILGLMQEAGYRYVRSVGAGPAHTVPAPFNGPFWYTEDGFPDLLETPSHAWHDNILTGQPARTHWPPVLPWSLPATVPGDARGVYDAYAPGIDYCLRTDFPYYLPIFHPWSIYRIDRQAGQIALLVEHARRNMGMAHCGHLLGHIRSNRTLASERPLLVP